MFLFIGRHFVDSPPEDPFDGALAIIAEFRSVMAIPQDIPRDPMFQSRRRYWIAQEACVLLSVYLEREGFGTTVPQLSDDAIGWDRESLEEAVDGAVRFMNSLESDIRAQRNLGRFERLRQAYSTEVGPAIVVTFSEQDRQCIRDLLDFIRELILVSPDLARTHRKRLLTRIERLSGEFRPEMHDLSLFWGFVAEVSLLVCPPSEDAQSLVPLMKGLIGYVWSAQARAFGLPEDTPWRFLGQTT